VGPPAAGPDDKRGTGDTGPKPEAEVGFEISEQIPGVGHGQPDRQRYAEIISGGVSIEIPASMDNVEPQLTEMVIEDLDEEDRRLLKRLVESGPERNTPFSPAERAEITSILGKLLDHFDRRSDHFDRRFDLTDKQFAELVVRLDKLGEASERLGRKTGCLSALVRSPRS
jgi:hypothetical protein